MTYKNPDVQYRNYFPSWSVLTFARREVINVLLSPGAAAGISATDIYKTILNSGTTVAQATIYRILNELYQNGKADKFLDSTRKAYYRLHHTAHTDNICIIADGEKPLFIDSPELRITICELITRKDGQLPPVENITILLNKKPN